MAANLVSSLLMPVAGVVVVMSREAELEPGTWSTMTEDLEFGSIRDSEFETKEFERNGDGPTINMHLSLAKAANVPGPYRCVRRCDH